MLLKIRCLECGEHYVCDQRNTSLVGPVLETKCNECGSSTTKNYSAFLDAQINGDENQSVIRARKMIALSHVISKIISNEEAFQRKKK